MSTNICVICGRTFECKNPSTKTCSTECFKALSAKNLATRRARGEKFCCAKNTLKRWTLVAPNGQEIEVVNFLAWARENAYQFFGENTEENAMRVARGISLLGCSQRGSLSSRPVRTYHGWSIKEPPSKQKACVICGKLFKPHARATTCSPECHKILAQRLRAEWRAAHKEYLAEKNKQWFAENKEYRAEYARKKREREKEKQGGEGKC